MYTIEYFISKFEAIPEEKWCRGTFAFGDAHCALGHCGVEVGKKYTEEAVALRDIFTRNGKTVMGVNDDLRPGYGKKKGILEELYKFREKEKERDKELIQEVQSIINESKLCLV